MKKRTFILSSLVIAVFLLLSLASGEARFIVAQSQADGSLNSPDAPTYAVVCDNLDSGCFSRHLTAGEWGHVNPSTGHNEYTYDQHAYWTFNSYNNPLDWGKWTPNLSQEGRYDVYLWYPHFPGWYPETNSAHYRVHHSNGDSHFTRNQAANYGGWRKLTTVCCPAGKTCYVKLTDETHESTGTRRVWFDAVKFVRTGSCASTPTPTPTPIPPPPPPPCTVPYFSQRDSRWINHPLRTNGVCSSYCNTIGKCGCTLTSGAMVFKYYGANLTPASLSDCMRNAACPFYWGTGAACSGGEARWVGRYYFSWNRLEQELNQNDRPVILGMHKYVNGVLYTHWVVVLDGSGSSRANYTIHDPWPTHGADMRLSAYNSWYLDWLAVYSGQPDCGSLAAATDPASLHPQPVLAATSPETAARQETLTIAEAQSLAASAAITGSAWLYRMTGVTMTVQLIADSAAGDVTEMLVWTDSMTETTWQPFSEFVYLPVSDEIYVRFRDASDNVSEMGSDTLHPVASPPAVLDKVFLPLIIRR